MPNTFGIERCEKRIPMVIAVQLSGRGRTPGVETSFTDDVSARGVRVSSIRRWQVNDRLEIESLTGEFRAVARVTYCQAQSAGFIIGLEFLEPYGRWVIHPPMASGKPLQG